MHLQHCSGSTAIGHNRYPGETGTDATQKFESFGSKIGPHVRQAGGTSTRPRQSGDKASANGVSGDCENDWNDFCHPSYRRDRSGSRCKDDVNFEPDELLCDLGNALGATFRPTEFNCDRPAVLPAELGEPFYESVVSPLFTRRYGAE